MIKTDMTNKNEKANNLQVGRIYINATTGEPCRLVNILPCQGVWLEEYDGEGYGETVAFEDVHYADSDAVQDYLDDYRAYHIADGYKPERQIDMNGDVYIREDEDYLCRD